LNYSVTHRIRHLCLYCTANGWLKDQEQQFFYNGIRALEKRWTKQWRFWGLHLGGGQWGGHNWACTDLYCHSEPPLTSGKLCFIINFIEGQGAEFLLGAPLLSPLNRPWDQVHFIYS